MSSTRSARLWACLLLALAAITALYLGPLQTRLLNDDYLFLEQARSQPLAQSFFDLGALGNYYRPLSRQIYFALLAPVAGGHPLVFHLVNYALFLGALVLLADLLLAVLPPAGAAAGLLYFALLPLQRVILTWVSCNQDLLALAGVLGALALYRRGRRNAALLPCAAALASKEAALPVAVVLAAWDLIVARRTPAHTARRVWPFALLSLAWAGVALTMHGRADAPPLRFDASSFAAAYAHLAQSLVGLEHPAGWLEALFRTGPALLPLLGLLPLAFAVDAMAPPPAAAPAAVAATPAASTPPPAVGTPVGSPEPRGIATRSLLGFAAVWLAAFGAMIGPVAYSWSTYYYTLSAVGGAVVVGTWMHRARLLGLVALIVAMLWVHAAGSATRAFAVAERPWVWTSHLTASYFDHAAALTDSMSAQLVRLEPHPPADARFFFATLPSFAGFQMGNGALVRSLYRKPGIESYFFSQFSDSTAGRHPCRFLYWDGARLAPLYARGTDTFFQVGCDLLLLDRPEGASHSFRRGEEAGESRMDLLYWTGWAELWAGDRVAAERAWTRLGFRDDSLRWIAHLRSAHNTLTDGDTLESRRHLITAIEYGVGRPQAHAVLGELMTGRNLKYGLLELKVATWLEPRDWLARLHLALGLANVRLDDAARRELDAVLRSRPALAGDSLLARLRRELHARAPAAGDVIEF